MAYRTSINNSKGYSTAMLNLGSELRLPLQVLYGIPPDACCVHLPHYANILEELLTVVHSLPRDNLRYATERMKGLYDIRSNSQKFSPGDRVWFHNPTRKRDISSKLQCEVIGKVTNVVYRIRKAGDRAPLVVHVDRLAPFLS